MTPRYEHSCPRCVYLGTWEGDDFYWCPQHYGKCAPTYGQLIRHGSHGIGNVTVNGWRGVASPNPAGYRAALAEASRRRRLVCKMVADCAFAGVPAGEV